MLYVKNRKNMMIGLMFVLCFMLILPNIALALEKDSSLTSGTDANITFELVHNGIAHKKIEATVTAKEPISNIEIKLLEGSVTKLNNLNIYKWIEDGCSETEPTFTESTCYYALNSNGTVTEQCSDFGFNIVNATHCSYSCQIQSGTKLVYNDCWLKDQSGSKTANSISKSITVKYLIEFDVPIQKSEDGWGSWGTVGFVIDGTEYYDKTHSSWWDLDYPFCRNITVANPKLDYPAYLNLTYDNDMNVDFSDARFVNTYCANDGSELDIFERRRVNSSWQTYDVKLDSNTTTVISVYYGNAGASSVSNATAVWGEGLIGYWDFDECSGTSTTNIVGASDTTMEFQNSPTWNTTGRKGCAIDFDASLNQFLNSTHNSSFASDNITIEGWGNTVGSYNMVMFGKLASTGNYAGYMLMHGNTDNKWWAFPYNESGTWTDHKSDDIAYTNDYMTYISVSRNVGNCYFTYYNGTEYNDTITCAGTIPSPQGSQVISTLRDTVDDNHHWNGNLDEIRVYDTTLSIETMLTHYAGIEPTFTVGDEISPTPIEINFSAPENKSYKYTDPNSIFVRVDLNTSADTCWVDEDATTNYTMTNDTETSWYLAYGSINNQSVGTHNLTGYCNDTVGVEYASSPLYYTYVDTNVSDCLNITDDGLTYDLNASMVDTQVGLPYCIRIEASDVILDCHGYNLTGSLTGTGIWATISTTPANHTNITIQNCKVVSYEYGIRVNGNDTYRNDLINIYNNTANSCGSMGIALDRSRDSNVTENEAVGNLYYGIYVSNGNNTLVNNNTATNQTAEDGLYFDDCDYCLSQYNILNYNNKTGFHIATTSINTQSIGDSAIGNEVYDFYSRTANTNLLVLLFNMSNTIVNFTLSGDMGIGIGTAIADPTGYDNIGKYVNVTNESAGWVYLNVTYEDSDLGTVTESTLSLWRNDGTWNEVTGSAVDTANNYVYGNITEFSVFAPLGTTPAGDYSDFINILTAFMVLIVIIGIFFWITRGSLSMEQIVGLLLIGMALAIIIATSLA